MLPRSLAKNTAAILTGLRAYLPEKPTLHLDGMTINGWSFRLSNIPYNLSRYPQWLGFTAASLAWPIAQACKESTTYFIYKYAADHTDYKLTYTCTPELERMLRKITEYGYCGSVDVFPAATAWDYDLIQSWVGKYGATAAFWRGINETDPWHEMDMFVDCIKELVDETIDSTKKGKEGLDDVEIFGIVMGSVMGFMLITRLIYLAGRRAHHSAAAHDEEEGRLLINNFGQENQTAVKAKPTIVNSVNSFDRWDSKVRLFSNAKKLTKFCDFSDASEPVKLNYICPILREVMTEPVLLPDGKHYEKSALESMLKSGNNKCPHNRSRTFSAEDIRIDFDYKDVIDRYVDAKKQENVARLQRIGIL